MKRNAFNEPRPEDYTEMMMALAEREIDGSDCYAILDEEEGEDGFGGIGWTAEVLISDTGDAIFNTLAYESREKLEEDLRQAGIELSS